MLCCVLSVLCVCVCVLGRAEQGRRREEKNRWLTAPGRCDVLSLIVKSRLRRVEEGELVTHAADHSEKSYVA